MIIKICSYSVINNEHKVIGTLKCVCVCVSLNKCMCLFDFYTLTPNDQGCNRKQSPYTD